MTVSYAPAKVRARLMAKVRVDGHCWLYTGAKTAGGYGWVRFKGKPTRAHRLSYTIFRGPIPEGTFVLHTCDVPACVNPDHLWLGTKSDNSKDAVMKGRIPSLFMPGQHHPLRKLSLATLATARSLRASGRTYREIADSLGVSEGCVYAALTGVSWSDVNPLPPRGAGATRA